MMRSPTDRPTVVKRRSNRLTTGKDRDGHRRTGHVGIGWLMVLAISTPLGWFFGVLYVVFFIVLGITSIRKGHWVMFIFGIFIPIFWVIGALLPATRRA
jgi:hypothetical protein